MSILGFIKKVVSIALVLSITIAFFIGFENNNKRRVLAEERFVVNFNASHNRGDYAGGVGIIAQSEKQDIKVESISEQMKFVEYKDELEQRYSFLNTTTLGDAQKIKITIPETYYSASIVLQVCKFKESTADCIVQITKDGQSIYQEEIISYIYQCKDSYNEDIISLNTQSITLENLSGGEYIISCYKAIYFYDIQVSATGTYETDISEVESRFVYDLESGGMLPEVESEITVENTNYRHIGWLNEKFEPIDSTQTQPKGRYYSLYMALELLGAKIRLSEPTAIMFGYHITILDKEITYGLCSSGKLSFKMTLKPDGFKKQTHYTDKYILENGKMRVDIGIYNIPSTYKEVNIKSSLTVLLDGETTQQFIESEPRSIKYVAERAYNDVKDNIDEENGYTHIVYHNLREVYSRLTSGERGILENIIYGEN